MISDSNFGRAREREYLGTKGTTVDSVLSGRLGFIWDCFGTRLSGGGDWHCGIECGRVALRNDVVTVVL